MSGVNVARMRKHNRPASRTVPVAEPERHVQVIRDLSGEVVAEIPIGADRG